MRKDFRRILSAGLILLVSAGCSERKPFPPADPDFAKELVFRQCAIVPRHSGTPGAERTARLIADTAAAMPGVKVRIDAFTESVPGGKITFRNVIAELPGRSGKPVILGAHYDAKKLELTDSFPAANDGASGVAVLLAVMKVLASEKSLPFPVHFIFFDGEECLVSYGPDDGLHGSRRAAKQYAGKASCMILADMVGDLDWKLVLPANCSPELAKTVLTAAAQMNLQDSVIQGNTVVLDDHVPFLDAGIPSVDLIDFEYGPGNVYWHTPGDTPDKVSRESLGKTADLILRILFLL